MLFIWAQLVQPRFYTHHVAQQVKVVRWVRSDHIRTIEHIFPFCLYRTSNICTCSFFVEWFCWFSVIRRLHFYKYVVFLLYFLWPPSMYNIVFLSRCIIHGCHSVLHVVFITHDIQLTMAISHSHYFRTITTQDSNWYYGLFVFF